MDSLSLTTLQKIPQEMAARVSNWLPEVNRERYLRFLDFMYHYTLNSGRRLKHVAQNTTDPEVQRLFSQLEKEEAQHFQLAKRDLASFGCLPSLSAPPVVDAFEDFWVSVPVQSAGVHLGAMYVLENVGTFLQKAAIDALGRLELDVVQASFVLVHLEADVGHGRELEKRCESHLTRSSDEKQLLFSGANQGAEFWVELHRQALSGG